MSRNEMIRPHMRRPLHGGFAIDPPLPTPSSANNTFRADRKHSCGNTTARQS